MMKLTEKAKLISLIREKTISKFIAHQKPPKDILHETEKNELEFYSFDD